MKSYGSPVRNTGAVSSLSQSIQNISQNNNQNQNNDQNQRRNNVKNDYRSGNENNYHHHIGSFSNNNQDLSLNLPLSTDSPRSPLLTPCIKSSNGSFIVQNAPQNKSPSWRARDRDRERGTVRSAGGTGGLSRMQSLGGGPGINHYSGVGPGPLPNHTGSHMVSGGMDVKAMIGEAKRRSDQRLNTDHQYLNRLAFACVRVGPTGFVWLSNYSGRVSDCS